MNDYLRYRLPGALLLTGGAILACETAAQAIGAGPAHHTAIGTLYNPIDGVKWLKELNARCVVGPWVAHMMNPGQLSTGAIAHACITRPAVIREIDQRFAVVLASGVVPFVGFRFAESYAKKKKTRGRIFTAVRAIEGQPRPLVIEIGKATGKLHVAGHGAGIKKGQRVRLVDDDVSQDTLVLGGKGAGKTTLGLNPILLQALRQDCGALIFNVKGDYDRVVNALAAKAGRKVRVIGLGDGAERIDLLGGVSPEMAAAFISALLLLTGNRASEAVFWNVNASNLSRAVLGLLWYYPKRYSLPGLYRYLFVKEERERVDQLVSELRAAMTDAWTNAEPGEKREAMARDLRYIDGCDQEIKNFYEQTHEIQSGVRSQLSQILAKMVVPELEDAFGTPQEEDAHQFAFEQLYERGDVVVVNVPLQTYGLAAAAIMTFAKLRFYIAMEQRRLRPTANQTRRVGLFVDECHQIAACSQEGMSDHAFLAMSRDTKTFCVFATQSVSALCAKIGDDMTDALIANLRQRIILRTEDRRTIDDALHLLGQIEYDRETTSTTRQPGSWFASKGTSHAPQLQAVANAALIRNLQPREALAILSIDGCSADDIITLEPEYV